MQTKIVLIIIFNHRYDDNLEKLDRIYKNRFSNVYYIMPFYDGPRLDVIPVYENSFCFQGYVAQALASFYMRDCTHYVFIGDDLLLNPNLNQPLFPRPPVRPPAFPTAFTSKANS